MCLAIPAKIIEMDELRENAVIDIMGVTRNVILATLDSDVTIGDYILVHAGFAIRKVNVLEAQKSIELHQSAIRNQTGKYNHESQR